MDLSFLNEMELAAKVVFWFMTGLIAVLGTITSWLVVRYLKSKDEKDNEQDGTLKVISDKLSDTAKVIAKSTEELRFEVVELRSSNYEFQQHVNREMLAIHQKASEIEVLMSRSSARATEVESKLDLMNQKIDIRIDALDKAQSEDRSKLKKLSNKVVRLVKQ